MRNARNIRLEEIAVTCVEPDARCALVAENISGLSLTGVRAEQTSGLLRYHLCENLTVDHCEGKLVQFTSAQEADYAAARKISADVERRMQEIASLIDSLSGRPETVFDDALEGGYLPAGAGGVLYLPVIKGDFSVELNGKILCEYHLPDEYCTLTCFACRIPDLNERENRLRLLPGKNFSDQTTAACFYRDDR